METLILPALLGLGLAASCGLNTFLPLLMLSAAAHFKIFPNVGLGDAFAWLGSSTALAALGVATFAEIVGDKIPAVDHLLDGVGTLARPAAGALATAAVFHNSDPTTAALAGLIIGAPAAFGFHAAKAGTRAASSATTLGLGNPILSVVEDTLAIVLTTLAFVAPWVVPVVILLVLFAAWRVFKAIKNGVFGKRNATPSTT